MNPELRQMLMETVASRSGAPADAVQQALLSMLEQDGGNALPSVQQLLEQVAGSNPTVGLLARYLAAKQGEAAESAAADSEEAEEAPEPAGTAEAGVAASRQLAETYQHLTRQVNKLYSELDQLRARNDAAAAALGACYLCWGEEPGCPVCHGVGSPGSFTPQRELFAQLVLPALRELQAGRRSAGHDNRTSTTSGKSTADERRTP